MRQQESQCFLITPQFLLNTDSPLACLANYLLSLEAEPTSVSETTSESFSTQKVADGLRLKHSSLNFWRE